MSLAGVEVAVDELIAAVESANRAQARVIAAARAVAAATPVRKYAAEEVASALHVTTAAGRLLVESSCELIEDYPDVFAAVSSGQLSADRARLFGDVLRSLDRTTAREVAADVLPTAHTMTPPKLRRVLLARAMAADPLFAVKRREQGVAARRVELGPQDDGTAMLLGVGLPAERAAAAWERLDGIARSQKHAGAAATLDQLRADAFLDLLDGTIPAGPCDRRGVVELRLSVTLVGGVPVVTGGELAGFGPVSPAHAVEIAMQHLDYPWRLAMTDQHGNLLATADLAQPPAGIDLPATDPTTDPAAQPTELTAARAATAATAADQAAKAATGENTLESATTNATDAPTTTTQAEDQHTKPQHPARPNPEPSPSTSDTRRTSRAARRRRTTLQIGPPSQNPAARRPNTAMTRWITTRDRTCRFPGCHQPARTTDLDHTIDHAKGGKTCVRNLCPLCRRHHQAKHEGGWQVTQYKPGHFRWTSPLGKIYDVGPEPP